MAHQQGFLLSKLIRICFTLETSKKICLGFTFISGTEQTWQW